VIEAHSYSSSSGSQCSSYIGEVKLNGVDVWSGGLCPEPKDLGIHVFKVNPFDCTVKSHDVFRTYKKESGGGKRRKALGGLQTPEVGHGEVVIVLTANYEPSMTSDLKKHLQESYGVDVGDVGIRGSFAFVAQKGYPAKTVLVKVLKGEENNGKPARLKVTITGMQNLVLYDHATHCTALKLPLAANCIQGCTKLLKFSP